MGEVYKNSYILLEKIGWGHFSTVWITKNINDSRIFAMKIQKSAEHYYDAAFDEINILNILKNNKQNEEFAELRQKFDPACEQGET